MRHLRRAKVTAEVGETSALVHPTGQRFGPETAASHPLRDGA